MNASMKTILVGVACGVALCLASAQTLAQTDLANAKHRHRTPTSAPAGSALQRRQDEVSRLRKQVDTLEASNQQAASKLQQQDQAIADLRRQLQAVPAASASVH